MTMHGNGELHHILADKHSNDFALAETASQFKGSQFVQKTDCRKETDCFDLKNYANDFYFS